MRTTLANKWVLITGSSSGFGAAAALAFAREGACLLLGARRAERLLEIAKQCEAAGAAKALHHVLDVSSTPGVERFVSWAAKQIQARSGPEAGLDILVNNAGGALGLDTVADGKDEDWETMLQTNVLGVLRVTRSALPLLRKAHAASIINIGSIAGHDVYEGGAVYCAAKAGERQITRTLRLELSGTGIRVGSIDPGMAETEFSIVRFKGDACRAARIYEGVQPLNANDIAEIIIWVASRPPHVNIDEIIVKPTDQAALHKVFRRK